MADNMRSRYPGVHPFQVEDHDIFFGRQKDITKLIHYIQVEPLVVLHSKSGMGKSSLINAGLIPSLSKKRKFDPLLIRFFAFNSSIRVADQTQNHSHTPVGKTIQALAEHTSGKDGSHSTLQALMKLKDQHDSLWLSLKILQLQTSNEQRTFLIFDQFEELFTYPSKEILSFKQQLADVLYTKIPSAIRTALEPSYDGLTQEEEVELFKQYATLIHELEKPLRVSILFAIRSDRINLLGEMSDYIPQINKKWFGLEALTPFQAEEAILNPAYLPQAKIFKTPVFDFENAAIDKILSFLTRGGEEEIESFQLQILCDFFEKKAQKHKLSLIKVEDVGNLEEVYANYYRDKLLEIDSWADRDAAQKLIEEGLISSQSPTPKRITLDETTIEESFGMDSELLETLVNTRIIRAVPNSLGGRSYEVSHDTLISPILIARNKRIHSDSNVDPSSRGISQGLSNYDEHAIQKAIANERIVIFLGKPFFARESGKTLEDEFADLVLQENQNLVYYPENQLYDFESEEQAAMIRLQWQKFMERAKPNKVCSLLGEVNCPLWFNFSISESLQRIYDQKEKSYEFICWNRESYKMDISSLSSENPMIYHLLGTATTEDSLILTNQQLFQQVGGFMNAEILPKQIQQQIVNAKVIFFLGVDFSQWFVQPILWRLIKDSHALKFAVVATYSNSGFHESKFKELFGIEFIDESLLSVIRNLRELSKEQETTTRSIDIGDESIEQIKPIIRDLIYKDNISKAINKLLNVMDGSDSQAIHRLSLIKSDLSRLNSEKISGMLSTDNVHLKRNQIVANFLDLLDNL